MRIAKSITINAPADQVWKVVAHEFAQIGEWASAVAESEVNTNAIVPEGATVGGRVCQVPGFGEVHENFTAYDEAGKTYSFKINGLPFFVTSAHNSWVVKAIDASTTEVSFQGEVKMMPVIGSVMRIPLRMQLSTRLQNAVEELKYYVETGEVHPRKQKLLAKATRQVAA